MPTAGVVGNVDAEDLKNNSNPDELRNYLRNDLVGKTGIEALGEPALRGTRGRIERSAGDEMLLASHDPVAGQDVHLSLDIDLQQQIQSAFASARLRNSLGNVVEEDVVLHGATGVLDVQTNQAVAGAGFVSTYDLNHFDEMAMPPFAMMEINDLCTGTGRRCRSSGRGRRSSPLARGWQE